ncbi:MAG TPA: family 16 glycoside hydrolase [Roseiflexaceae bacterium]|nr:family 16 glycoside hydrolase [Roseiflexaceae bacterium]
MKRYRLSIALTTGLVALVAILAVNLSLGGIRAEEGQPLFPEPDYPPTPTIAPAPERPALEGGPELKSAAVLFADSFDGQKAASAWQFAALPEAPPEAQPTWAVRDGRLVQDGTVIPNTPSSSEATAYVGDPSWTNYAVSAKFYDEINGVFGLVARRSGDSYYRYSIIANYYDDTPKQLLEKVVNGVATPLAVVETEGFEPRRWYTVTMSVVGPEIRVWLDGRLVAQATDGELKAGQAGLYSRALGWMYIDDVVIARQ